VTGLPVVRRAALGLVVLLAVGAAAYFAHYWWTSRSTTMPGSRAAT
jgi:hypothetical protein